MKSDDDDRPEPDRAGEAPHPRATLALHGQEAAEAAFLAAVRAGRVHHAWLLTGPRGIGKATFAWRAARHLVAGGAGDSLDMDPANPVFRRALALAEPRLFLLRRGWDEKAGRLRQIIDVEETRRLRGFLQLSATDGGWRAVIVDAAEEMAGGAANALLKLLEEPPARVAFFLVSHQPALLLPTIRSRCRSLRLAPLSGAALALALAGAGLETTEPALLAELAGGSAGAAHRLAGADGPALYREIAGLAQGLPRLDRPRLVAFVAMLAGREALPRHETALDLVTILLARLARTGAAGTPPPEAVAGEAALLLRLAPDVRAARAWAGAASHIAARNARARAVNLDPSQVMLDTFLDIEATAERIYAAA